MLANGIYWNILDQFSSTQFRKTFDQWPLINERAVKYITMRNYLFFTKVAFGENMWKDKKKNEAVGAEIVKNCSYKFGFLCNSFA